MRYFLEVAYRGTNYSGWQIQQNAVSVQEILQSRLSTLLNQEIEITASGRTDAGVHCRQQFAHFDLTTPFPYSKQQFLIRLNAFLPADIAVADINAVAEDTSARFDATSRSYQYQITQVKNPFLTDSAFFYFKTLDLSRLQAGAALLQNFEDFTALSKTKSDVNHHRCQIFDAHWEQDNQNLAFHITANRFLRGMVRLTVGLLLEIGAGACSLEEAEHILASKKRQTKRFLVPAHGLYLNSVTYPGHIWQPWPES